MNATPTRYSCIIVDDDELDSIVLAAQLRKYPFIAIAGIFESAEQALVFIQNNRLPDVIFLDIDMPGMDGLTLRKELSAVPACIFVTSHAEYALQGFETAALDYIVKPLRGARFEQAMARLEDFLELHYKAGLLDYTLGENTLFIKDGHQHIKLHLYDIFYLEALKDYTGIITRQRKYCVLALLGNLLKEKSFSSFIRIHRSYAVQKHFVKQITGGELMVHDTLLPIGRRYQQDVDRLML